MAFNIPPFSLSFFLGEKNFFFVGPWEDIFRPHHHLFKRPSYRVLQFFSFVDETVHVDARPWWISPSLIFFISAPSYCGTRWITTEPLCVLRDVQLHCWWKMLYVLLLRTLLLCIWKKIQTSAGDLAVASSIHDRPWRSHTRTLTWVLKSLSFFF
jgi:hypothetical protein